MTHRSSPRKPPVPIPKPVPQPVAATFRACPDEGMVAQLILAGSTFRGALVAPRMLIRGGPLFSWIAACPEHGRRVALPPLLTRKILAKTSFGRNCETVKAEAELPHSKDHVTYCPLAITSVRSSAWLSQLNCCTSDSISESISLTLACGCARTMSSRRDSPNSSPAWLGASVIPSV